MISTFQEEEKQKDEEEERTKQPAAKEAPAKEAAMNVECVQPPSRPSPPVQGLYNKDMSQEVAVDNNPGWAYPEGTKTYQRMKTVQIGPSNLRVWVERTEEVTPRDLLRNVLGSR